MIFIKYMLFWLKFFTSLIVITIVCFNMFIDNLMSTTLIMEFSVILIFFIFLFNALLLNLNWLFGFSFIIIILGGLEIALSFLLLNL